MFKAGDHVRIKPECFQQFTWTYPEIMEVSIHPHKGTLFVPCVDYNITGCHCSLDENNSNAFELVDLGFEDEYI